MPPSSGALKCGECAECKRNSETGQQRASALKFVWVVAGDLLLCIKGEARHRHNQLRLPPCARVAPMIVDLGRHEQLMRRRGRRPIEAEERAPPADDEDEEAETLEYPGI